MPTLDAIFDNDFIIKTQINLFRHIRITNTASTDTFKLGQTTKIKTIVDY